MYRIFFFFYPVSHCMLLGGRRKTGEPKGNPNKQMENMRQKQTVTWAQDETGDSGAVRQRRDATRHTTTPFHLLSVSACDIFWQTYYLLKYKHISHLNHHDPDQNKADEWIDAVKVWRHARALHTLMLSLNVYELHMWPPAPNCMEVRKKRKKKAYFCD